ncbi:MAG: hypothetical protein ACLFNM_03660 [Candidatus Woesearchaeota archaeon]
MRAYDKVIRVVKRAGLLESIEKILTWDMRVMMPEGAMTIRSQELVAIATATHRQLSSSHLGKHIQNAKQEKLTFEEQASIREIEWTYSRLQKVKQSLVTKRKEAHNKALHSWRLARNNNNFSEFEKQLDTIFKLSKKYALSIKPYEKPYTTLIEDYEKDIPFEEIKELFLTIKKEVQEIIKNHKSQDTKEILGNYKTNPHTKEQFNTFFARTIGFDFTKGRIDRSDRSFASWYGRIVIRHDNTWFEDLSTILHESGHSMYTQGLDESKFATPLGAKRSLGIDEAMAILWQNNIGSSEAFWDFFYPHIKEHYNLPFEKETFLEQYNKVKNGFIRTKVSELYYPLHIIMRFEIEEEIINNNLATKKIPKYWNQKNKEYFGIEPKNLQEGALQDVHWAKGFIGYFPTYLLGSIIAAQLFEAIKKQIPDVEEQIREGNFKPIKEWLTKNIFIHGQKYSTKELIKKATGEDINPQAYLTYLRKKYTTSS